MQSTQQVRSYFTRRAGQFDGLYADENPLHLAFNKVFRRAMFQRYELTLKTLGDLHGKRILDIGCGSGRYAVDMARAGAEVLGIDFSEPMLDMARTRAREKGLESRVRFINGDFVTWSEHAEEHFDVSIAIGVLDYIEDAAAFIQRMAKVSDTVIASFPAPSPVRAPLRKARYALRGCPVHFYWKHEVVGLYQVAGLNQFDIRRLGLSGFWAYGRR